MCVCIYVCNLLLYTRTTGQDGFPFNGFFEKAKDRTDEEDFKAYFKQAREECGQVCVHKMNQKKNKKLIRLKRVWIDYIIRKSTENIK